MKQANFEDLRCGDVVCLANGNRYRFIGEDSEGCAVVESSYIGGSIVTILGKHIKLYYPPVNKVRWVNLYVDGGHTQHLTEIDANAWQMRNRIGGKAFKIEYEE